MNDSTKDSCFPGRVPRKEGPGDLVWEQAWAWVRQQYALMETGAAPEEVAPRQLIQWLKADPRHREAYEQASRLWLAAGLLPPDEE
ncbi:FecR/PupR family sigma factor regulator [Paracidovorax anthurii]|uniref:Transmembrane sensor n=1 Tax=Paracidovorax anthurii TaxID=78229 RepID=A0A328YNX5_9BURK|nr:DUF4880 domain-containing protein [Paracidovorax anthurii]RAR75290.1 transmembrane sensor [Paracidovorax anthurii]